MNLLRRKSVPALQTEALTDHSLKRALGALNLTILGARAADEGGKVGTDGRLPRRAAGGVDPHARGHVTGIFNLPAIVIIAIITTLLVIGIKESANVDNVIVFVKVAVVLLFIFGAAHA